MKRSGELAGQRMEIGAAVEAGLETGGRGLLAMCEEAHLTEGAPENVPQVGRQY